MISRQDLAKEIARRVVRYDNGEHVTVGDTIHLRLREKRTPLETSNLRDEIARIVEGSLADAGIK